MFSYHNLQITQSPPDWLANPLTGQRIKDPEQDWWKIPDFDQSVGDIKQIWELSRLDWVLAFAQRTRQGNSQALLQLNSWLTSWCEHNPPYRGPNWKCGQEASIRVMNLGMAALILEQVHNSTPGLSSLIKLHLQRIEPTLQYAMAQDNNHGTSEAAALFIGGSWLAAQGMTEGTRWESKGRYWLENRAVRLIGSYGSFSQYSLNYHRMMLDSLSMVEVWRRHMRLAPLSKQWQERALAATQWLRHMINPINGDGPNVGANDGARLLQLTDSRYRDHRPTVQLALALFAQQRAYAKAGPWDHTLSWLNVTLPQQEASATAHWLADDGGFAVLRRGSAMVMLRYPRFCFRPSQADALHLDLWQAENNLLRDAGTYSYNTTPEWLQYFGGTASHNTVQFDDRDQMPRLSRFLLGDWLKTQWLQPLKEDVNSVQFAAGYQDSKGASHRRYLSLGNSNLQIVDEVAGFKNKAVLRWRLIPGKWTLEQTPTGPCLRQDTNNAISLTVTTDIPISRCELCQGWESRHYLEKTPIPVLEIEIQQAGRLTTEVHWAQ